jgi:hypothetical protein
VRDLKGSDVVGIVDSMRNEGFWDHWGLGIGADGLYECACI